MRRAALGLALAIALVASEGRSAEPPLTLDWHAPRGCPSRDDVTRRVRQLLSETTATSTTVEADATIRRLPDGRLELALTTEVGDARGTKTVSASSCAVLAEAAAVFLALTIDSTTTTATTPVAEESPVEAVAPAAVTPPSDTPTAPSPSPAPAPSRSGTRIEGTIGGSIDVGTFPRAAPGLVLDVHLRRTRLRAGILGSYWSPSNVTFDEVRGAGASFRMFGAGVFGCYALPFGPFEVGPCANVEARIVEVTGVGIRTPMVARSVWPMAGAGVLGSARLNRWFGVFARADGLLAIGASEVALATSQENVRLYDPGGLSGRFGGGIEIGLP